MYLITIDGPAGSGKTTLADLIHDHLSSEGEKVAVIHMDDLYDGWEDPFSTLLTQKIDAILHDGAMGKTLTIPQYNWALGDFGDPLLIAAPETLILEGVGSGQRSTRESASISIWVDAPHEIALQRVLDRDGEQLRAQMERWQKLEAEHFAHDETKSAADYQVKSAP